MGTKHKRNDSEQNQIPALTLSCRLQNPQAPAPMKFSREALGEGPHVASESLLLPATEHNLISPGEASIALQTQGSGTLLRAHPPDPPARGPKHFQGLPSAVLTALFLPGCSPVSSCPSKS